MKTNGRRHAQKHSFALVNSMRNALHAAGITPDELWDHFNAERQKASGREFTERDYVWVAARLQAAKRDRMLFNTLCNAVRSHTQQTTAAIVAPSRAFEIRFVVLDTHTEKRWVEIEFPNTDDLKEWGQRISDDTGNEVVITNRSGRDVCMRFSPVSFEEEPEEAARRFHWNCHR